MMTQAEAIAWLRAVSRDTDVPPDEEAAAVLLELIEKFVPRSEQVQHFLRGELGSTAPGSR